MTRIRNAVEKTSELPYVSRSQSQQRKKAPKGTVSVQVFKDRLRLCWSYHGKRYFLYVGLPDSKINRVVADTKLQSDVVG